MISMIVFSISGFLCYGYLFSSRTHMMTYVDKINRLKEIKGRKAIFIGGSATHFGVCAENFEKETQINSLNMGMHASINLPTYIDDVKPYMNKGDILFIIPEYDYYCTEWKKSDSQNVEFAVFYDTRIMDFCTQSFDALPNLIYTGWSEWSNIFKQIVSLSFTGKTTESYHRQESNQWGDYMVNIGERKISPSYEVFMDLNYESVNSFKQSVFELQKKGINVFVLFPPYVEYAYNGNNYVINKVYSKLKQENKICLLFSPENSKFEKTFFYDTVYHLNLTGKKEYTRLIIETFRKCSDKCN